MSDANHEPSLETLIQQSGGVMNLLRNAPLARWAPPGYPTEYSSWRDEQRAWLNGVALLELSYHMPELHLRGTEVIPFLEKFAINKLDPFPVLRAKQLVVAAPDGNLITDAIIFHEEEDFYRIVGDHDWIQFNLESSTYDVSATVDPPWYTASAPRDVFRIQLQGPQAVDLVTELVGGNLPSIKFFHIGELEIAGKKVRALRHGMAGTPGFEIYGAWDDQQVVRAAIEDAGRKYAMRKVGALAYGTSSQESSWMPIPLAAIYTAPELKEFREWLGPFPLAALGSLGGSMTSTKVEDYYIDPIEAGYGHLVDWSRDFVGRAALREKADNPRRRKVTLEWNDEDVAATVAASLFGERQAQTLSIPVPHYAWHPADTVQDTEGRQVGVSQWSSYSDNAGHVISTAVVEIAHSEPGTQLVLLWGNPDVQTANSDAKVVREIRVTVAPAPYFQKVTDNPDR
ncbi:MAG TPA: aminomethyl transferase family protein [Microbacterium sp.]|uniref:aminomethyl transferase family protein n=1 Tax=Microbacterium sp. TaxID=51671 RepID=UPI002CD00860|nr:aminomethyl transferase family protein [Microbacterium sp.]HWI32505.1 aminomethyl transferase family protein [Microbacterium sp.]